jgi:hypothetical protein
MMNNRNKIITAAVAKGIRALGASYGEIDHKAFRILGAFVVEEVPDVTLGEVYSALERLQEDATIHEMLQNFVKQPGDEKLTYKELVERAAAKGDAEAITVLRAGFLNRRTYVPRAASESAPTGRR